jgi:hypothetical protein
VRPTFLALLTATGCRAVLGIEDPPEGPGSSGGGATMVATLAATGTGAGAGTSSSTTTSSGAAPGVGGAGDGGAATSQGGAGGEVVAPAGGGGACDPPSGGGAAPCSPCGAVECCIDCEAGLCREAIWTIGAGEALSRIAVDGDQVIVQRRSGLAETTLDWLRADGDDPSPHASVVLPIPSLSSLTAAADRVYVTDTIRVLEVDACGGVRALAEEDFVTALRREDRVYAVHRLAHDEGEVACFLLDGRPCTGFAGGSNTGLFGGLAFDDDENPWWSMYEPDDQGPVWLVGPDGAQQVSVNAEPGTIELRDVTMVDDVPTVFADATSLDCVFSIDGAANMAALVDPDLGPLILLPHADGLMICEAGVVACRLHETGAVEGIAVGEGAVFYTEGPRLHRLQRDLRDVYDDAPPRDPCFF